MESNIEEMLEALLNGETTDIVAQTRIEKYLKACCEKCGCGGLPVPESRVDSLLYALADEMAHGDITVESLTATENGTYTAPTGKAYSPVNVNVATPTPTGTITITDNGTYDVTEKAEAIVNVAGATEPYIEETYNENGELIDYVFHGYTKIRDYAFYYCKSLAFDSLPNEITSIGNGAFSSCQSLALTSLPSGVTRIGNNAFSSCKNLALTELPNGITFIGLATFSGCEKLAITSIPSGVTLISSTAFKGCISLTKITFRGTPNSIDTSSFKDCTNLRTINVPWAQGAVANAPWGATNATINYNYTGA